MLTNDKDVNILNKYIDDARLVFEIEANAVRGLSKNLGQDFSLAIDRIMNSKGRTIICGMGKSGIIGRKIAATLSSTGTPSFFMHPGEAYHGDLGMVTKDDVFIALSNSGETDEVLKIIPFLRDNGNFLISMTGNERSTLAKSSDCHLNISVDEEACPLQLAPTSSTTATLAMGDAIAVTLMKARDFKAESFARFHPGGSLGRRLLRKVEDEMVKDNLPYVLPDSRIIDVISAMTTGGLGLALVKHSEGIGIITDGDIRRAIEKFNNDVFEIHALQLMSASPAQLNVGTRVEDAITYMDNRHITSLLISDGNQVVGVFKK